MKIKKEYKEKISREFRAISNYIKKSDLPQRKTYFLSGTYGILNRILNIEYDQELLFIYFILHRCHEGISSVTRAYIRGEITIPMPDLNILLDKIADEIKNLADSIEKNEDYIKPLRRITELVYTTTGNGAYLYSKGMIKV